ncbi:MAG: 3-phosphoshikimate 1-carboxyvinyltransferase [Clostridia bacterium]|nr:3-phosphoshikimate 1-carboxyvinyltransferase [Clostridia bacterium]
MNKTVSPSSLRGTLSVIPSKSASHRAVMMAAMAEGETVLAPLQLSRDIEATLSCARALGLMGDARIAPHEIPGFVTAVIPGGQAAAPAPLRTLDCGESGSTLRFFIPLALDGRGPVRLVGHGRLMQRPLHIYERMFAPLGVRWTLSGDALTVEGALQSGEYALRGDVSSQFITGLLLALPRLPGESVICITTPLESRAYVELTRRVQRAFGVVSSWEDDGQTLRIPGNQKPVSPGRTHVESDWSHAAFYLTAGAIGKRGPVTLTGLDLGSAQGDRAIAAILRDMGADIREENGALTVYPSSLRAATVDASQVPDLVPILSVAMAAAPGESRITGAGRLRIKESDRLRAMHDALTAAGADVTELPDGLIIRGGKPLHAAVIDGCNDHRIVMSMAVASALSDGDFVISDAQATAKSAPAFWEEFTSLGGLAR